MRPPRPRFLDTRPQYRASLQDRDELQSQALLGEDHFESHFNLALVKERRGTMVDTERETLAALRLNFSETEALNLQSGIYAREGETVRAARIFQEIIRIRPDYQPARANLLMLHGLMERNAAVTTSVAPRALAVGSGAAKDQGYFSATDLRSVTAAKFEL